MNIEREFPLHVAIWNNDTEKLADLISKHKVSDVFCEMREGESELFWLNALSRFFCENLSRHRSSSAESNWI